MVIRHLSLCVIMVLLLSCSSTHTPAPVSTATSRIKPAQHIYTVNSGDTLFSIAWLSNLDPNVLAAANNIEQPYTIFVGQQLSLDPKKLRYAQTKRNNNVNTESTKNNAKQAKKPVNATNSRQKNVTDVKKTDKTVANRYNKVKRSVKKLEPEKNNAYSGTSKQQKAHESSSSEKVIKWLWPTSGKIIKRFSGAENGNKGIDIIGKRGQPVKAAASGKVVYAGSALRGYGKLLIIKHNDDYLSAYAHNNMLHVKERDTVNAGQHIADVGSTDAARDMLHFEIRYRGKSVNPEQYLPRR